MADSTGKRRFRFRLSSWKTPKNGQAARTNSDLFSKSDERSMPGVLDSYPPSHQHKETATVVEENAYRVQPASRYTRDYVASDRRTGFPGGMFQHPKPDYSAPEPTLNTDGGWERPTPAGWKLPPDERLGKVTNDPGAAAEYLKKSVGPSVSAGGKWWSSAAFKGKKETATIDSREAVKKYGGQYI